MSVWEVIATEAAEESPLWACALLPPEERQQVPVFSPLGRDRFALATETIYEGYLLHYGRPRLFSAPDRDTAVLLGDYLYAHGLVRLAATGDVGAVFDFAELISLCTQLRAERVRADSGELEGHAWAATATLLGHADGRLEGARARLRLEGSADELASLARETAGAQAVENALASHLRHVE